MKTKAQLVGLINVEITKLKEKGIDSKKKARITEKIQLLKKYSLYLDTEPSEEYLQKEKDRITKIIKAKESQYDDWCEGVQAQKLEVKERKSAFKKLHNLSKLKQNVKTIRFLLKNK